MKMITKEELEEAIHKVDLVLRPYALFVHPLEEEKYKQVLKDAGVEDKVLLRTDNCIEAGKAVAIDRKKLEEWTCLGGYKPEWIDFEKEDEDESTNN